METQARKIVIFATRYYLGKQKWAIYRVPLSVQGLAP